ncbi:MAG TPA: hypothetical protein PKW90_16885, partial [Myxococcota bacterium]|nr:hypothetical protein [Myxococcota bacterium]
MATADATGFAGRADGRVPEDIGPPEMIATNCSAARPTGRYCCAREILANQLFISDEELIRQDFSCA